MTYAIDKETMLFVGISDTLAREMREWCRQLMFIGTTPWPDPPWVTDWLKTFGFDDRQRLLVLSSVLAPRALWSLLARMDAHAYEADILKDEVRMLVFGRSRHTGVAVSQQMQAGKAQTLCGTAQLIFTQCGDAVIVFHIFIVYGTGFAKRRADEMDLVSFLRV